MENIGKIFFDLLKQITEYNPQRLALENEYYEKLEEFLPDFLYKYYSYSEYAIKNLIDQSVCFSNPSFFNDPFDSGANLSVEGAKERQWDINNAILKIQTYKNQNEIHELYEELCKNSFFTETNYANKLQILKSIIVKYNCRNNLVLQNLESLSARVYFNTGDDKTNQKLADYAKNTRILSLSASKNNTLMWAHYGKSDSGFCLAFRKEDILNYLKKEKVNYVCIVPVYYSSQSLRRDKTSLDSTPFSLLTNTMIKKEDWSYEQEWRIVRFYPNFDANPLFRDNFLAAISAPNNTDDHKICSFLKPSSIYLGNNFNFENLICESDINIDNLKEALSSYLRNNSSIIKQLSICEQILGYYENDFLSI